MKILFVCRCNRFRSRIAEAYFKKINKNKNIKVDSAGLFKGKPIDKREIKEAEKFNLNIRGKTKAMSSKLIENQDLIVNVAEDIPRNLFKKGEVKKLIRWEIKDSKSSDKKGINRIINEIIKKVDLLVNKLKERK